MVKVSLWKLFYNENNINNYASTWSWFGLNWIRWPWVNILKEELKEMDYAEEKTILPQCSINHTKEL